MVLRAALASAPALDKRSSKAHESLPLIDRSMFVRNGHAARNKPSTIAISAMRHWFKRTERSLLPYLPLRPKHIAVITEED